MLGLYVILHFVVVLALFVVIVLIAVGVLRGMATVEQEMPRFCPSWLRPQVMVKAAGPFGTYSCWWCGRWSTSRYRDPDGWLWEMDHVIPWTKGGPTTYDNLVPSCHACNQKKGNQIWV